MMRIEPIKLEQTKSIERLLEYLRVEHAEGRLTSLMTVHFDGEGNINTQFSGIPSVTRAIGALERLKMYILCDAGDT